MKVICYTVSLNIVLIVMHEGPDIGKYILEEFFFGINFEYCFDLLQVKEMCSYLSDQ